MISQRRRSCFLWY